MGHIITDLKETFRRGNIFIQLIYINVSIFIIGTLINVFLQLFQHSIRDRAVVEITTRYNSRIFAFCNGFVYGVCLRSADG